MKNTKLIPSILLSGIAMGTAWAVRGQFGHEHGAAWAGAIGCMTLILLSGRADWYRNVFKLILAGGLGWGIGGIMSYGKVIGYCKSTDFGNVYYGFLMLFIIGALYGFVGGGLFGISLSKEKDKKPVAWHQLIFEMTVGAILGYFFIIEQFGCVKTPPRSELWAACFGISLSLVWYMIRNQMESALRVAIFSAFGAGFGFAFGNLLQVLGNAFEIQFNMWNVMEYTLGFCGGAAMSYAVFTSEWEELENPSSKEWVLPVTVLTLIIPNIMWQQNTGLEKMSTRILAISSDLPESLPYLIKYVPHVLILGVAVFWIRRLTKNVEVNYKAVFGFYVSSFGLYILLSIIITGAIFSTYRVEQYLYVLNFAVVLYFLSRLQPTFIPSTTSWRVFSGYLLSMVFIIALIAFVAVSSHEMDLSGTNYRFGEASNPEIH
jgi:hypothetical protein